MREDRYQRRTRTWRTPDGRIVRETRREWGSSDEPEYEERPRLGPFDIPKDIFGIPKGIFGIRRRR